jgi:tRNA threonylcarbamoyl adenosine modification protein (Sua5/YciO/YrdC/YwlC family)
VHLASVDQFEKFQIAMLGAIIFLIFYVVNYEVLSFETPNAVYLRANMFMPMAKAKTENRKNSAEIISIEEPASECWKLTNLVEKLRNGGVGVICTDTCYSFVTSMNSRNGVNKLKQLKGTSNIRKPLSVLCKDLSMIAQYTSNISDEKWLYKLLKSTLPGPYTYIMPSSTNVPKVIVEHNKHTKRYKRKEIGIRMPDDQICQYILDELDQPLLSGSIPELGEDNYALLFAKSANDESDEYDEDYIDIDHSSYYNNGNDTPKEDVMNDLNTFPWLNQVDFIVLNGPRGVGGSEALTTVVDFTSGTPVVIRKGKGSYDFSNAKTM